MTVTNEQQRLRKNAQQRKYRASPAGQEAHKKADTSPKGIARRAAYAANPQVKARKKTYLRNFNRTPHGKLVYRKWILKTAYNFTPEGWDALLISQGGRCGICPATTGLCVDHDHKTGKVRGLLCRRCNAGIGLLQDTTEGVAAALVYLNKCQ